MSYRFTRVELQPGSRGPMQAREPGWPRALGSKHFNFVHRLIDRVGMEAEGEGVGEIAGQRALEILLRRAEPVL